MFRSITTGLLLMAAAILPQLATAAVQLIPEPAQFQLRSGSLILPTPIELDVRSEQLQPEAALLSAYLAEQGVAVEQARTGLPGLALSLDTNLGASAYSLEVGTTGVVVTGGDRAGVVHGLQTIRQLIAQAEPTVEGLLLQSMMITDKPRFTYRGMHLDVSRHFFDVAFIKRYIDLLALHKMNYFHWHLTDDQGWRLQSKAYPRLTEIGAWRSGTVQGHTHDADAATDGVRYGGFYSWEEVREVVAYAAQRHITVVPEIDVPGHASAMLAAYPELGCSDKPAKVQTHFGVFPEILCPRESTFEFLEVLLAEVAALFPGPYIHIGGDEVRKDQWQDCAECDQLMQREGLAGYGELQAWFVNRTEAIVHKLGRRIVGWDEILDGEVRPSAVVMSWRGTEGGIRAAQLGHDVIMTPLQHVYFDFYQGSSVDEPMAIHGLTRLRDVYAFQPVPGELTEQQRPRILGAQGNLWTEYIPDPASAERMVLPRMSALAEVLWSPAQHRDFDSFAARLPTFETLLLELGYQVSDSHYKPHLAIAAGESGAYEVTIESLASRLYFTTDGTVPGPDASVYTQPLVLEDDASVRAVAVLDDGSRLGDARLTLVNHLGRGASVRPTSPEADHPDGFGDRLLDGLLADDRIFRYPEWETFGPQGMDLVIEFAEPVQISELSLGVEAGYHRSLYRPTALLLQIPGESGDWVTLAQMDRDQINRAANRLELKFKTVTAQQLRVVAANEQRYWSEEHSAEQAPALRFDEIIVR